MLLLDHC